MMHQVGPEKHEKHNMQFPHRGQEEAHGMEL
jgi:hypothetical protein